MLKFSRSVAYALESVIQLAQAEGTKPIPCSRLASEGKMPERFLLQVLRNLVNHGILVSTRGAEGGYMLARSADQISLLELIEAVDGQLDPAPILPHKLPDPMARKLHARIDRAVAHVRQELASMSVADILS